MLAISDADYHLPVTSHPAEFSVVCQGNGTARSLEPFSQVHQKARASISGPIKSFQSSMSGKQVIW